MENTIDNAKAWLKSEGNAINSGADMALILHTYAASVTPAPITYWDESYRKSMHFLENKCGLSESLAMAVIEHFRGMAKLEKIGTD